MNYKLYLKDIHEIIAQIPSFMKNMKISANVKIVISKPGKVMEMRQILKCQEHFYWQYYLFIYIFKHIREYNRLLLNDLRNSYPLITNDWKNN